MCKIVLEGIGIAIAAFAVFIAIVGCCVSPRSKLFKMFW